MKPAGGNDRLDRLAELMEVQYRQSEVSASWNPVYTAAYRWEHTLRVAQYGERIAEGEGVDRELCVAGCLLHDIAYFHCEELEDWDDHGRIGAELSRPLLAEAGFSHEEAETIRYAVGCHADGEAGFSHPPTPVADIVSDADNVDRFNAIRILMWCMTERGELERMAASMRDRVLRLQRYRERNPLETKTGRELFARQLDLQIAFFEAFLRDVELTRLPWRHAETSLAESSGHGLERSDGSLGRLAPATRGGSLDLHG